MRGGFGQQGTALQWAQQDYGQIMGSDGGRRSAGTEDDAGRLGMGLSG